jgi:hypothetical protein
VQYITTPEHNTTQHNIIDRLHTFLLQARDAFQKSYSYSFRHMYGKEGSRKDYTPFSCMKIIMGAAPEAGAYHGCPYRLEHVKTFALLERLQTNSSSIPFSFPLSLSHTHSHSLSLSHTQTLSLSFSLSPSLSLFLSLSHTLSLTLRHQGDNQLTSLLGSLKIGGSEVR